MSSAQINQVPTAAAFTPLAVPGCALWLDGADQTSMTLNQSTLTSWQDKSGNGYMALSFSNSVAPPTWVSNLQNGRGVVQYAVGNGSFVSSFTITPAMTVFALYYPIGQTTNSPPIEQSVNSALNPGFLLQAAANNFTIRGSIPGPSNLVLSNVTMTWNAYAGAQTYTWTLYESTVGTTGPWTQINSAATATTSAAHTPMTIGNYYYFTVIVTTATGVSPPNASTPAQLVSSALLAPTNLSLTIPAGTSATATMAWTAAAGATTYSWILFTSPTATYAGTPLTSNSTASTSATFGITIGSYNYFSVRAVTATLISAAAFSAIVGQQIVPPTGLAIAASGTTVTMSWSAYASATSYTWTLYSNSIYAYGGSQVTTGTVTGSPPATTATYSSAIAGTYYYFTLTVTTPGGVGFTSGPASSSIAQPVTTNYTTYQYTGANQYYTPAVTSMTVALWGAAGGGGGNDVAQGTTPGGAGAYLTGTLAVTPGQQLTIIVGGGGVNSSTPSTLNPGGFGGGGSGNAGSGYAYNGGSGGGRSAIQVSGTELVDAGGGGGSGYFGTNGGCANYSTTLSINGGPAGAGSAGIGIGFDAGTNGGGGTQTAGGSAGSGVQSGAAGSSLTGGNGAPFSGGGGGGYYGGGGGGNNYGNGGRGGGGSSYTTNANFALISGSNSPNSADSAPATTAPGYISGVARGNIGTAGGNGLVLLYVPILSPTNPTLTTSGTAATMSWTAVAGVTGYNWTLYQSATNAYAGTVTATGTTTTATTATASTVTPGLYGYFTVAATLSGYASAAVASAVVYQLPAPPSSLAVTQSGTSIVISWGAVAGATAYTYTIYSNTIFAYGGSQIATATLTGNPPTTSYTYPSGVAGTYYYFTVNVTTALGTSVVASSPIGQSVASVLSYTSANTVVTTIAGGGSGSPSIDGTGAAAKFNFPQGLVALSNGNIAVADGTHHRIRILTLDGVVTTLAGNGTAGGTNGTGTNATFNNPFGVVVLSNGNIVVSERDGHRLRLITPAGVVTTLAGSGGAGSSDGTGTNASFNYPCGLALLLNGNIAVGDSINNSIRIVTPAGVVTTLAGVGGFPFGIGTLLDGNIAVADYTNSRVKIVTYPGGSVTTLAGSGGTALVDGTGVAASFYNPVGLAVLPNGNIIVADTSNGKVRLVTYPGGVVTTLANFGPYSIAALPNGNILIPDNGANVIRLITLIPLNVPPASPTLTISAGTASMSWTAAASASTYYWLLYSSATPNYNGTSNSTGFTTAPAVAASQGSLTIGNYYYYTVYSSNASGVSPAVASPVVQYIPNPYNLTLSVTGTGASMTWSSTGTSPTFTYILYQTTAYSYTTTTSTVTSNTTTSSSATPSFTPVANAYYYYSLTQTTTVGTSPTYYSPVTQYTLQVNGTPLNFTYTGSDQTYTTSTSFTVHMWGAGGAGGSQPAAQPGGAGAYLVGTVTVASSTTYTVMTGGPGTWNTSSTAYGGGGASGVEAGGGGGRSALRIGTTEIVNVGGGGGSGYWIGGGAANYSPTINGGAGYTKSGTGSGGGGTQTAGGAIGSNGDPQFNSPVPTPGSYLQGGRGAKYSGGGGGGYYGGGGGVTPFSDTNYGGGGGSSYTTNPAFTLVSGENASGGTNAAPGTGVTYYQSGVAQGGPYTSSGGSGLVVIIPRFSPPASPALAISGSTASLKWTASAGASTYYWLLYSSATPNYNGTSNSTGFTTAPTVAATQGSLVLGTYYYYTVYSSNAIGVSAVAASPVVQNLPNPSNLTLSVTSSNATLSWSATGTSPTFYYTLYQTTALTGSGTLATIAGPTATGSSNATVTFTSVNSNYYYYTITQTTPAFTGVSAMYTSPVVQYIAPPSVTITNYSSSNTVNGRSFFYFKTTGTTTLAITNTDSSTSISAFVLAGGGSGGDVAAGGGGAGGLVQLTSNLPTDTYTAIVGAGGVGNRISGAASQFKKQTVTLASAVGGGGGSDGNTAALSGGCGGGGAWNGGTGGSATAGQGYAGGNGAVSSPAAGGGAPGGGGGVGGVGGNAFYNIERGGDGGIGITYLDGAQYGGGGGGASSGQPPGTGTYGGGEGGGAWGISGSNGIVNTGGGGGGHWYASGVPGNGGSGIVILSYALPLPAPTTPSLAIASGTATLSWTPASGATSNAWVLYQSANSNYRGTSFSTGATTGVGTSSTATGLSTGSYWYFTVATSNSPTSVSAATASSILFF